MNFIQKLERLAAVAGWRKSAVCLRDALAALRQASAIYQLTERNILRWTSRPK